MTHEPLPQPGPRPAMTWRAWLRTLSKHGRDIRADYRYGLRRAASHRHRSVVDHGTDTDVIVLPGIWERANFLHPLEEVLVESGYRVRVVTHLWENLRAPEVVARRVTAYLDQHDIQRVTLVAHSKGGLVAKHLMQQPATADRIAGAVCLCSPFDGSRWGDVLPLPGIGVRELRRGSPWVTALARDAGVNERITSIYPTVDPHVPDGSYLAGATNIELEGFGHSQVLGDPRFLAAMLNAVHTYAGPPPLTDDDLTMPPGSP